MSLFTRNPVKWVVTENLAPARLNRAFERLYRDLQKSMEKRFSRFSFDLDFTGVANTSSAEEFIFRIKAPFAWTVEFVELEVYEPTGTVTDVAFASSLTNSQNVKVAPAGATTRARATAAMIANSPANTEQTFTLTVTAGGAYTLDRCIVRVHGLADRGNAGLSYTTVTVNDAPRFSAGESVAAAKLNTAFSSYETSSNNNTAADRDMRITVFALRSIAVTLDDSDRDVRLPSTASRFHTMDVVNLGAVGDNLTGKLTKDNRGSTVASVTVNGSGSPPAKSQGNSVANTQANNSPTDATKDYHIQMARVGAGIIPLGYVVVYSS